MDVKIRIAVLVPHELLDIINKQSDPMFIASREQGRVVIKPLSEYGLREASVGTETEYRKGFMAGVTNGYEDGYHRGFQAGSHRAYAGRGRPLLHPGRPHPHHRHR